MARTRSFRTPPSSRRSWYSFGHEVSLDIEVKQFLKLRLGVIRQHNALFSELEDGFPRADQFVEKVPGERGATGLKEMPAKVGCKPIQFFLEQPHRDQVNLAVELMKEFRDPARTGQQLEVEKPRLRRHQDDTRIGEFARLDEGTKTEQSALAGEL